MAPLHRMLRERDELNSINADGTRVVAFLDETCDGDGKILVFIYVSEHVYFGNIEIELEINCPVDYPSKPFVAQLKNERVVFHPFIWTSRALRLALYDNACKTMPSRYMHWDPRNTIRSHCIDLLIGWLNLDRPTPDPLDAMKHVLKYRSSSERDSANDENAPFQYCISHGFDAYKQFVKTSSNFSSDTV